MKKYYKFATLLIVLCLCFAVTGCFGNKPKEEPQKNTQVTEIKQANSNYLETLSDSEKQSIIISCKSNIKNIGTACELYAADHNGFYPNNLDELKRPDYIKVIQTCPLDSSNSYKFVSKKHPDYYILKCPNHKIIFDSIMGLIDGEEINNSREYDEYCNSIKSGSLNESVKFTDDDLKELGIK